MKALREAVVQNEFGNVTVTWNKETTDRFKNSFSKFRVIELPADHVVVSRDVADKVYKFLDETLAMLPCESRQRDLPEDDWERAMFLRDLLHDQLFGDDRGKV